MPEPGTGGSLLATTGLRLKQAMDMWSVRAPGVARNAWRALGLAAAAVVALSGCAGTRKLDKPLPVQDTGAVAYAADDRVAATIDAVIVRDGPGSWVKNAEWDEYLLRVRATSREPVEIVGVVVVDSLGTPLKPQGSRSALVDASERTAKRYKDSGIEVHAGLRAGTLLGASAVAAGAGLATGYAAAAAYSAAAATAAVGMLAMAPVLAVAGAVRGVQNHNVDEEIKRRRTPLPLSLAAEEERRVDTFFPFAPAPERVEVKYRDASGEHVLAIDTRAALAGLHLLPADWTRPSQAQPSP